MRRFTGVVEVVGTRTIVGVAPVLHFPQLSPAQPKNEQVKKNTKIALEVIKKFKGPLPAPYKRKYSMDISQIEKEVEALLGGAAKLRKPGSDDQPMDKLSLMERCLRHGIWSYHKDNGKLNLDEIRRWLVYTPLDEVKFNELKREQELKELYAAQRKRRMEEGQPDAPLPKVDWRKEYSSVVDREVIAERRCRYDQLAVNTTERDEAQINDLIMKYREPMQQKRLDDLVELLERFKPVLAREAIMQRLTIKHLEGQLGIWRYLDWNPEFRDRAELELDNNFMHWFGTLEERRFLKVRLRTPKETKEIMEKTQQTRIAAEEAQQPRKAVAAGSTNAARDKLLKEVLALQARLHKRDDESVPKKDEKKGHH
jgi:hypothetical protein